MFERFDEGARRTIFYARVEAAACGAGRIEAEHLLLGLLREDKTLCKDLLGGIDKIDAFRAEVGHAIEQGTRSPAKEIPLSDQSKRALHFAVEDADRAGLKKISTKHLFAGLLRLEDSKALKILKDFGVDL